jgi:glycosyltransferase involved in cell wall biosynthesis
MKYSFIIPVYNGEKYIDNCLSSILNQTYKNFEVIIINDGSTDKSLDILKKYSKENRNIRIYDIKNKGVSNARNYGVSNAIGDYFIFVDVDDYVDLNMLEYINTELNNRNLDLVKYNYCKVKNIDMKKSIDPITSEVLNGEDALLKFIDNKVPFDLTCIYAYKTEYFKKNKFIFEVNRYHEDFGLIPYVIMKSKKVLIIDKILYYYVQSKNSITRSTDYKKTVKKFDDILYHFDTLYKKIKEEKNIKEESKKIFNSFIANAVLFRYMHLNKEDKKLYKKELKNRKIVSFLLENSIFRKIKKTIYKKML